MQRILRLAWLTFLGVGVQSARGECPPEALIEPETCGDDINSGCSGAPPIFWDAACGDVWCGTAWAEGGTRDTDWYLVQLPDPDGDGQQNLTVSLNSEFPGVVFIVDGIGPDECAPEILATGCGDEGMSLIEASAELTAPDTYAVFVGTGMCDGSGIFNDYPCGTQNDYTLSFACSFSCPADLDGDQMVGINDLLDLLDQWGPCDGCSADLDGDGNVGINDLLMLIAAWGPCAQ